MPNDSPGLPERSSATPGTDAVSRHGTAPAIVGLTIASLIISLTAAPRQAGAGAWTRAQGSGLITAPVAYSHADEGFDADGDKVDRLDFELVEIAPKFEYGLLDSLTLGVQPTHRSVEQETAAGGTVSNSGLAETDVYLRQNLWRSGDAAFSTQGLVKLPINPQQDEPAALGRDQVDAKLSLLYGNRIRGDSAVFFYNFDVGYRRRFKEPDDQVSAGAFAGWSIQDWTVVVSSDNTIGLDDPELSEDEVLTAGRSFSRFEAGLGTSYRLTDHFSLSANVARTYAGEQVGAANTYGLSAFAVW